MFRLLIICCLSIFFRLLNKDGALLAYAGFDSKDARVTSAIASNIWGTYSKSAVSSGDLLELVCLECEV